MTRALLTALLILGAAQAAEGAPQDPLAVRDAALAAMAKRFTSTPATWLVSLSSHGGEPRVIEAWTRTSGDWRQVRAVRRNGAYTSEVRSLGEVTWIKAVSKAGTAVAEVADVAMRQRLAAIEGMEWFYPRSFDPPLSQIEAGTWRGKAVWLITGSSAEGSKSVVSGIRWVVTKEGPHLVQVDRFGGNGQVLWSAQLERYEQVKKADPAWFAGFSDAGVRKGLAAIDLTDDLADACRP